MEINKITLEKKVIPSLLHDKDGKKILENVRRVIENQRLTKTEIIRRFNALGDNYKDESFWIFFVEFFNSCFKSSIEVNMTSDESFKNMIIEMQQIKFDYIFVEDDSMKITNRDLLNDYLRTTFEEREEVVNLSADNSYRLVIPATNTYSVNASYYEPKELKEYPSNLVCIKGDKISVNISSKVRRNAFFNNIKKSVGENEDQVIIEEFVQDHLNNLKIDIKSYFENLKRKGVFIKKAIFSNSSIYFNIGLRELIDFDELIDSDFFMSSKMDLISFKKIQFIYSKLIGNKSYDFIFTVETNLKTVGDNKSVKFMISFNSNSRLTPDIKTEIKGFFEAQGLHFNNQAYELPSEYYINNIFYNIGSLNTSYSKLMQIDPENRVIAKLIEKEILGTEDEITLNESEMQNFKNEVLIELENQQTTIDKFDYKIEKVFIDHKDRQSMRIRIIDNRNNDIGTYNVIFYPDVRDIDKTTSIVIPYINYSQIIGEILDDKKESALKTICRSVALYLKNKYNLVLEKEANNSYTFLEKYCEKWEVIDSEMTAQKAGVIVEKHLNILLKFIYRNYLLIGGKSAPDGYLTVLGENYLFDSKQHQSISQGEFDKVVRYIFTYTLAEGLAKSNSGVFVICRGKIGNSLNPSARTTWQSSPKFNVDYKFGFITIEYFLRIFEFLKMSKVKSNPEILQQIFESFKTIVIASNTMNDSTRLTTQEDIILDGIAQSIREIIHTPQRRNQL